MAGRRLEVEIIGDSRSLERAFGRSSKAGSGLGRSLSKLGRIASVGVGAAFVGLAATLKVGFDELAEGQKVAAQTGAALKSTGGIANVTAKDVDRLAQSLSNMSGIDDELIQSGENLLLTFKNVRNEVGAGNAVFDRATKSALNLSVAGFGSVESASKMMGKALNDPIKGMTALGRAGVTFSEDQKKAIKALVESGHALEAQKMILKEVESQVGGSAKAYGETLPGQLSKLKNAFEEAAAKVASTLLPHLMTLLDWVNAHMPEIQAVIQTMVDGISKAFEGIGEAIEIAKGPLGDFKTYLEENPAKAKILAGAIGGVAVALGLATIAQVVFNAAVLLNPYVAAIVGIGALVGALTALYITNKRVHKAVDDFYRDLRDIAIPTLEVIRQGWDRFGKAITAIVAAFVRTVTIPFQNAYDIIVGTFRAFKALFTGDWRGLWKALLQIVDGFGGNLVRALAAQMKAVYEAAKAVGRAIVDGVKAGVQATWSDLTSYIGDKMSDLKGLITSSWKIGSPSKVTIEIGKQIAEGLGVGFGQGMVTVQQSLADKIRASIDAMIQAVGDKRSAFGSAFSTLASEALAAFDKLASDLMTKTERKIARQDEARANADRKGALSDAQSGLAVAQATFAATPVDSEGFAQAHQALLDAQKAVADASFAIQRAADEKKAAAERKALDNKTALRRRHFQEELSELEAQATRLGLSATAMNNRLLAIFKSYGVPFKKGANELGSALAEGLRDAMGEVENAAVALKNMIMKHLSNIQIRINVDVVAPDTSDDKPKNRQHGGPVRAGSPYIVGEAGPEMFVPSGSGRIVPGGGMAMAGSGGGTVINITFPNYLGSKDDVTSAVRDGLLQMQRRGIALGF